MGRGNHAHVLVNHLIPTIVLTTMKWEGKLYVGGKVFIEELYATNHQDARETATARNPKAKVIGVNPIVGS